MALLKSVDNVPGINFYDYRDYSYYGKYEFRMRVEIPGLRYTYWCDTPDDLDLKLLGKTKRYGTIKKNDKDSVTENIDALKAIITIQQNRKKNKTLGLRIEGSTASLFSNDLSELQKLAATIGSKYEYDYTQVQTSEYAGVKHFVGDPPHKYRVYLKSRRVEENFHSELAELFKRQPGLYPSSALKTWTERDPKRYGFWMFRWTSAAHFIDYDDESTLSYLAIIYGDLLGKKYKLEKRPDPV